MSERMEINGRTFTVPSPSLAVNADDRLALAFFGEGEVRHGCDIIRYSLKPGAVDFSLVRTGRCPLLIEHLHCLDTLIGMVLTAGHEDGGLQAIVRFARNAKANELWEMVVDGFPLSLSLSARIRRSVRIGDEPEGVGGTFEVTSWQLRELSLCVYGKEEGAHVRRLSRDESAADFIARMIPANSDPARYAAQQALKLDRWRTWGGSVAPARLVNEFGLDPVPFFDAFGREVEAHCADLERDYAL